MRSSATADDWRRFASPAYRRYHYLALAQGVVSVLAGFDVIIPFALAAGTPPFLAVLLGVLPLAGGMAQLVVPRLLDRTDGNLRGLTLLIATIAEPRGLYFAALAALAAAGILSGPVFVAALALLIGLGSVLSSIVGANLLSWHSAVLQEDQRRLVVPRLMAVSLAMGALLLVPLAVLLDALVGAIGLYAYALPFLVSGVLGVAELHVLRGLRHPGRVIVPPAAEDAQSASTNAPELARFMRVSAINALGMGFAPAMSVYIISVVGLSAGFSMLVGAIGTLTMVFAAAYFGGRLAHASSTAMLRNSFAIRALAMVSPIFALPGFALAPLFLIASAMLGAIGFSSGTLAGNEKLYRLISGPAVIRHHARFLARTSGAMTAGQLCGAAVLAALGPLGYPAFAVLYAASASVRVLAYAQAPASVAAQPGPAPETQTAEVPSSAVA